MKKGTSKFFRLRRAFFPKHWLDDFTNLVGQKKGVKNILYPPLDNVCFHYLCSHSAHLAFWSSSRNEAILRRTPARPGRAPPRLKGLAFFLSDLLGFLVSSENKH